MKVIVDEAMLVEVFDPRALGYGAKVVSTLSFVVAVCFLPVHAGLSGHPFTEDVTGISGATW